MIPTVTAYAQSRRQHLQVTGFRVLNKQGWFRIPHDTLAERPLLIGRTNYCDFRIRHRTISRRHCSIGMSVDGRIYLIDAQSKNGLRVAKRGHCGVYQTVKWHPLEVGDLVRLGNIRMMVVDPQGNCPIQINKCADLVRFALQIYGTDHGACNNLSVPRKLWHRMCARLNMNAQVNA